MSKADDNALFEELAMPLFDPLYNFARWLTRDRAEAEDLVQETYAKALKGFATFQPGTNFRAWIFRILRNAFLNSRTGLAAARTVPLEDEQEGATPPSATVRETPESLLLRADDIENVRAALEQLPVFYREAVLLADVEEMSYQEIAETLSIPIGTVMSRIARGRKGLREALSRKYQEAGR